MKLFTKTGIAGIIIGAAAAIGGSEAIKVAEEYYLERKYADGIRKSEEFKLAVRSCQKSRWETEFPDDQNCKKALALLASSPKVVSQEDALSHLQDRMLFYFTYSEWLECRAGVSVMRRTGCGGKGLTFIDMRD